tara:strand:- start:102 stop:1382 length:1281 start_codon:yes stop_codon:yes gene_type:complete
MKKKLSDDWSSYYLYYILILIVCGVFILYSKHDVGNDSSLSDWLINYSGGFVRRGLVGQIVLEFAYFFSIKLRDAIVIFQIISFVTYYLLVFFLLRKTITNRLLILSVFSPIFILFPIAEIEAFGRKEIFILLIVILYFFSNIRDIKTQLIFKFFIFPISILIWEPAIIFYPYLLLIDLVVFKINKLNKNLIWLFLSYLVVFFVTIFVYLNSISSENFDLMRNTLINDFGENCYMSCLFVGNQSQNSLMELTNANAVIVKPLHIIRYTLIILIGFYPLFNLLQISKLNNKELFFLSNYKNLLFPFIVVFSPALILYVLMYDWGRIVHISYSFMLLSYIFLLKNNLIKIDQDKLSQNIFINLSNKMFFILFIIFCLCWNPKTVMRADIATNSFYKIIYNSSKKIFGFEGIRFFQDSPIIKFHKKYIE